MHAVMALVRLCECIGSSEPWLIVYTIRAKAISQLIYSFRLYRCVIDEKYFLTTLTPCFFLFSYHIIGTYAEYTCLEYKVAS